MSAPQSPPTSSPSGQALPPSLPIEATASSASFSNSDNNHSHTESVNRDTPASIPPIHHHQSLPFFAKPGSAHSSPVSATMQAFSASAYSSSRPTSSHGRSLSSNASIRSEGVDVPTRTTSLRRKPVPNMVSLPNHNLPSSHPFASAASTNSNPASTASTPYSPGGRPDEDLFFSPPRSGPLPPRRPKSLRDADRGHSPAGSATDIPSREEALRLREEALLAREAVLREREEMLKREEALRQREDELRRREELLRARESAATPVSVASPVFSTSGSPHRVDHLRETVGTTTSGNTSPALDRPLPSLPDPSQVDLRRSSELGDSPITPRSDELTHGQNGTIKSVPNATSITHSNRPSSRASTTDSSRTHKTKPKFSIDAKPTTDELIQASSLSVRDEEGQMVSFGDLMPHPHSANAPVMPGDVPVGLENEYLPPITKTAVFFIRSFWCGQCQDYTMASLSLLDPVEVRKAGVRVVVISNGDFKVIKAYRRIMKCNFPLYVDGPRKLYALLG
jgi:hypothetical protein